MKVVRKPAVALESESFHADGGLASRGNDKLKGTIFVAYCGHSRSNKFVAGRRHDFRHGGLKSPTQQSASPCIHELSLN